MTKYSVDARILTGLGSVLLLSIFMSVASAGVTKRYVKQAGFGNTVSATAFLRINQYYVVYSKPTVPYMDKSGNFMVSLQGLSFLLTFASNAQVVSSQSGEVATFSGAGHRITFRSGSASAQVDGHPTVLPCPAFLDRGSKRLLVPISVITDTYKIQSKWDPKTRVLSLQGEGLTRRPDSDLLDAVQQNEDPHLGTGTVTGEPVLLIPTALTMRPGMIPVDPAQAPIYYLSHRRRNETSQVVQFTLKNTSGSNLTNVFFNAAAVSDSPTGGIQIIGVPYSSASIHNATNFVVKAGASRSILFGTDSPNSPDIEYIVVWPVSLP